MKKKILVLLMAILLAAFSAHAQQELDSDTDGYIDMSLLPLDDNWVITGDWDNTANPWAENEIVSTVIVEGDAGTSLTALDDDEVAFDDTNSDWTATAIGPALEEMVAEINSGDPNSATAKVHWSQLTGVPAGFADGADDEGAGGTIVSSGTPVADDIAQFTDASTIKGITYAELAAIAGFESALEAVLDSSDLVGYIAPEPADAAIVKSDEAETLTADWVNTAHPWLVNEGGTGAATLTDGGVLLGSGTNAITAMAALADGEIIVGDGTTDPVAESGATARTSLGLAIGSDVQAYDAQLADLADGTITGDFDNTANPWAVNEGGTGAATFTDGGILLGSGTGAITALGVAANGQIPVGDGTTDPVLANITETGDALVVTNGAGTIALSAQANVEAVADGLVASNALAHARNEVLSGDVATVNVATVSHYGGILNNDGQASQALEWDLDSLVEGMHFCAYIGTDDDNDTYIDPAGSEVIYLDGTALTGGYRVVNQGANSSVDDEICCKAVTVGGTLVWSCKTVLGVWENEGS